jgi:hypothetical protein
MSLNPISRRKTVLALVEETTEGTPVRPSGATDFTALQEGFSMNPSFNVLANAELKSTIGKAKDELGSENPEASMSHYMKASGVEGQDVDYKVLLKAAFGARDTYGTERDTIAASTTSLLKVDVGEGVEFPRGRAFLLKDPTNGFQIRNALSVSGDDVTLAQLLVAAPAVSVLLGKCVAYKVADEGHPPFTMWQYLGNAGAIEMMAGCRVTEMNITAQAGEYINAAFTIGGISYSFNPIKIDATNNKLDYEDDGGNASVTIPQKEYKDPHQLVEAIQTGIDLNSPTDPITVSYSDSTGKFTFAAPAATVFKLEFLTGANNATSIDVTLGFTHADKTLALTYTSESAQSWAAPYTPNYDDVSANVAKHNEIMLGGSADITCFKAQSFGLVLTDTKTDVPDLCEESGKSGSLITGRTVTATCTYLLQKHDAEKFRRFRTGASTSLTYNFGVKTGGQWSAGSCVNIFIPTATITSLEIQDSDGLCVVNVGLSAFVEDGLGELYLNFV